MSPYNDPAVSAGEIADYLDQLRIEATPSPRPAATTPPRQLHTLEEIK
ncbi:hypothetical protein [Hymenobacter cheonanensis]|nr:hypothetical protein [Hymenobacter sp. CA2-7]MDO7887962.1 hypothetical protein [Hymenobacter sp. CA2-7]